ncbi:uncharacterized protein LOC123563238 [Mercenaria mercenaria]|uniref:uncharacterized protein LOC123563238 n=1 Tax=Mercenaria mercenaria TaxID=6596 RepID=UPI00234F46E6|nr:uncharacterized protein LOC123563238 [Mercenaria mercenaria]
MFSEDAMICLCRRNCIRYVFTLITMCVMVSFYIAALKHNRDIHKRFHVRRLKVKRDVHSQIHNGKHRVANMTIIKEPPHADKDNSSFKGGGEYTVHVYIVEEHHEVIPYWFAAARREIIPKSGNTLVHIDGHADLEPPLYVPGYPGFAWPHEWQLKFLMQTNNAFIQASAMTGLVNRVIWVWPDWVKTNHESGYFMSTVRLGLFSVTHNGNSTQKGFCACTKSGIQSECRTLTNVSRMANKSSSDGDFIIPSSICKIKKILIVEEIHEDKALAFFGKSDWIAKSENIILDIDEDYYGRSYAIEPLLKADLSYSRLNRLSSLIASYICPITFTHEKESDKFLMELLSITRAKRVCKFTYNTLENSKTCNGVAEIDLHRYFKHQLDRSVTDKTVRLCSLKLSTNDFVQQLLAKLATFTIKQIRALQKTGFCLRMSPKSLRIYEKDYRFGLCIGSNIPEQTSVLEHNATQSEISTRSILLKYLFKKLTDHSVELVTISRSVRDGYTPRHFFEQIEVGILNGLNISFNGKIKVHYDPELLGGMPGWPARHL